VFSKIAKNINKIRALESTGVSFIFRKVAFFSIERWKAAAEALKQVSTSSTNDIIQDKVKLKCESVILNKNICCQVQSYPNFIFVETLKKVLMEPFSVYFCTNLGVILSVLLYTL